MPRQQTCTVVVGDVDADPLIPALTDVLSRYRESVALIDPTQLAASCLCAGGDHLDIDGRHVTGIIFRAWPGTLSGEEFVEDDADFAAGEARAVWLHALALPTVVAVNRGDEETWFSPSDWSVWRRRFIAGGVACSPLEFGDVDDVNRRWYPWAGGLTMPPPMSARRAMASAMAAAPVGEPILVCGDRLIGGASDTADELIAVFRHYGVILAGAVVDSAGRVVTATALPYVPAAAAVAVANAIDAELKVSR